MTTTNTNCPGHETTDGPAGITAYCDGTCQPTMCLACDEYPANANDELCQACDLRNQAMMLAQSGLEELKSIERALKAQDAFAQNATNFEIIESRRRIKRLIEAHDALEDAGTAANYGLTEK